LFGGTAEDWEDEMTTFVTQARLTKEGFNTMIAAPEDRAEIVGRLIAEVGGKLIAYYLTSGEYDILLIFEGPSYEDTVPALIVAAAESGVADLKTVTALTSSEMKSAFVKARSIAASYRAAAARATSSLTPQTGLPNSGSQREEGAAREAQGHLEKLLPLAIADSSGVNVNESERERSGIIRGQFYGVWRGGAIFRGALKTMSKQQLPF
jgi:uncharacterized protein with GYD domain